MKNTNIELAPLLTKAASKQTYYTIRLLADRELAADAYRAYAYFRWVDDTLDAESISGSERSAFIGRQKMLLEKCYLHEPPDNLEREEEMLFRLVRGDTEKNSGLQSYLRNMMQVMDFDASRRGRVISQTELNEYTRGLACAVTEALHYFIGHGCHSSCSEARYSAVTAAHITHMLRDTYDDLGARYFNIPREILDANHIGPQDVQSAGYRTWVQSRVQLARTYFKEGKEYLSRVRNPRCRLASFAYVSRFEWLLNTIEKEGYCLRPQYNERKNLGTGLRMALLTLSSVIDMHRTGIPHPTVPAHGNSLKEL